MTLRRDPSLAPGTTSRCTGANEISLWTMRSVVYKPGLFVKLILCLLVAASFTLFPLRPALAYEYEHYVWTYYLALHVGFTERQAYQIASANYSIDWAPLTSPMPFGMNDNVIALGAGSDEQRFRQKWRRFHAFSSKEIIDKGKRNGLPQDEIKKLLQAEKKRDEFELWAQGLQAENPGPFLHFNQDREPHGGWADLFGHGPAAHLPDFFSADKDKARKMTDDTIDALLLFKEEICVSYQREYCNKAFRKPNMARIYEVLDKLFEVNKLPAGVTYTWILEQSLKELSLKFDHISYEELWLFEHSTYARINPFPVSINVFRAVPELQTIIFLFGGNSTVKYWLLDMPGPDQNGSHRVITEAIAHDKINPASDPLIKPFRSMSLLEIFGVFDAKLPQKWYQYSYNKDAVSYGSTLNFAVEDVRIILPDTITIEPEGPFGTGPDAVYRAKLDIPVKIEGMAPLAFIKRLPTLVVSTPGAWGTPKLEQKRLDDTTELRMVHEYEWPVEEVQGKEIEWNVRIDVYGLEPKELRIPVKFDEVQTAACNSAVDQGGDAGGGVTVDLGGFSGKAGFTWEMYRIKDEMLVTVGGVEKTTGCVSGSGTFELDIPPGAATAEVKVVPNCTKKTSGTKWKFEFECPLRSTVTADGTGAAAPDADANGATGSRTGSSVTPTQGASSGLSPFSGFGSASGSTTGLVEPTSIAAAIAEIEPNNNAALAIPMSPSTQISGSIDKAGDADYFAMTTSTQGEWELTVTRNSPGGSIGLGVHNANGGNWLPDQTGKGDGKLVVDLKWPGKYVLRVNDTQPADSPVPYQVSTRFRPSPDANEPNDTVGTAKAVTPTGKIVGAILPVAEADYYVIEVPKPGEWTVRVAAKPDVLALGLGVHRSSGGNWLADNSPKGDGKLVVDIKWPGKYVLRVVDNNKSRSIDPYVLDLNYVQSQEKYEPNDTVAIASPVDPNTTIVGTILPRDDADYFLIDIPHPGEWTIAAKQSPRGMQLGLGVHRAAGGNWLPDQSGKGDDELVVDLRWPGKYVLRVIDINRTRNIEPYSLELALKRSPDNHEPNNAVGTARPVQLDGTITGAIMPKDDVDYYLVDVSNPGEWTVEVKQSPQGMQLGLGVHSAAGGNWLPDNSPKGDGKIVIDIRWPGKYVLRIVDTHRTRDAGPYLVETRFTPAADAHEPNNVVATASPVALNGSITGAILPRDDSDYYLIEAPGKGTWSIEVSSKPAGMDVGLGVHSAAGGNWLADKTPQGDGKLLVEIPAKGKYILRAVDINRGRSAQPYVLTTNFR